MEEVWASIIDYNIVVILIFAIKNFKMSNNGSSQYSMLINQIDKRKAHLSTLINSGQLSKEDAIQALATPLYNANDFENDKAYLLKKFELTASEFENILGNPVQAHQNFKSDKQLWKRYFKLINILKFKFKS